MRHLICVALLTFGFASPAYAQEQDVATSALRACVVRSLSAEDSVTTARWLFIAMSRHPDLPQSVRVSDADGLEANRHMGALVNRMLFDACANETSTAVEAVGYDAAFGAAFSTMGETAMTHLMTNADVLASVIQLGAYVDRDRLNALAAQR